MNDKLKIHLASERPVPKTNMEFMFDIMNFSPYGGLCQAFVIEAVRFYCEQIVKTTPKADPSAIINPVAWHGIATDILKRLKAKYDPKG
jgi:glutamate racemase